MEYIFFAPALIVAALLIGLLGIGAIIGIATQGLKKHGSSTTLFSDHVHILKG